MPPAVQHSPLGGIGEGAEAMDGAGGRGERGRDASTAVGGNADRGSPGGAATLQEPQRVGATAGLGSPARPESPVGDSSSGPAANGGEAPPTAERGAAMSESVLQRVLQQVSPHRQGFTDKAELVVLVVTILIENFPTARFPAIVIPKGGIYCQRVKVSEPNKFEVLLETAEERLELCESDNSRAIYNLRFKEEPQEKPWSKFVENGYISASKMLATLRKMIKKRVDKWKAFTSAITVERKRPGNPAITLLIKTPPAEISVDIILTVRVRRTWPSSTQDGLRVVTWLGSENRKSFMRKLLYFIPKENSWQLSFSHIEKLMMNNHGNTKTCCESDGVKCCREDCLELMMCLLEKLKDKDPKKLSIFSSHYIKTSFFHSCVSEPGDQFWHSNQLENCFKKVLEDFMDCLKKSKLPHFFIPRCNLLSENYKESNTFLAKKIKEQVEKEFEIFGY